jgi:hypothetical protein
MKQLNHSPEAAAAVLGVSLKIAHERIAWLRNRMVRTRPVAFRQPLSPSGVAREHSRVETRILSSPN